ncbi:unnamed protein product [Closterium sp. NIES-64]|nr:unnamed protein product [Closterium sp. NIES-64]
MDCSNAEGDAADLDDMPSCSTRPVTGLQFLRGVHQAHLRDEEAMGDGSTEWVRRPRMESGNMEEGNDAWCPSPRTMTDAAKSEGIEEWVASPRREVAAEPAATVATQVIDAATLESTGSMAPKKRRMTQQVLQWETPPPKPAAPPPRPAPPPVRPLSDEEKKEKAYLKAQKSGSDSSLEEVDCVVSLIEHRYIDNEGSFGAGLSPHLSPFMARVKKGEKKVKVEGVDASGRPVKHTIELSELPDKSHKYGGTVADCVKMGKAFAREVVYNLKHRMWDLRRLGGTKLFRDSICGQPNLS